MAFWLGAHTSAEGGIDRAVRRAHGAGMTALQLFTSIPKYYGDRASIRPERVARFQRALDDTGIPARHVLAHAAYVLNTAAPEHEKWSRARDGLAKELERSTVLGLYGVCFHPGAATSGDRAAALDRVAAAMTHALESVTGHTRLLIENTAGAGLTIGRTPDEIAAILAALPPARRHRAGYGLDTCHLFAAGHDIVSSPRALRDVLDGFERACGEPPAFFHLNDSLGALGSNRDRHALLGEGGIGVEPFRWLLADARAANIPLILETPQARTEVGDDDVTPDANDVRMMALLHSLVPDR